MELIESACLLGIEIELENFNGRLPDELSDFWRTEGDGSLREGGIEFVFRAPLGVNDSTKALKQVYKHCIKPPATISMRTGIHVHMNIKDISVDQFKKLCTLYALLEEPLFAWAGERRDENCFCMPWYKADGDLPMVKQVLESSKVEFIKRARNINRYAALNLNAVSKFGSLEFRHLLTTFDLDRVMTWINLLLHMYEYATKFEGAQWDMLDRYSMLGAGAFLEEVFKKFANQLDADKIDIGLLNAHDLLSGDNQGDLDNMFYAHRLPYAKNEGWEKFSANHIDEEVQL